MVEVQDKITDYQLELLKGFKFIHEKKQFEEIKSLISYYLESKLDEAITNKENNEKYNAEIYEKWLSQNS